CVPSRDRHADWESALEMKAQAEQVDRLMVGVSARKVLPGFAAQAQQAGQPEVQTAAQIGHAGDPPIAEGRDSRLAAIDYISSADLRPAPGHTIRRKARVNRQLEADTGSEPHGAAVPRRHKSIRNDGGVAAEGEGGGEFQVKVARRPGMDLVGITKLE